MNTLAALRLRLSLRHACGAARRRKTGSHSLSQAASIAALALAAGWSGGAAMAQVGRLAEGAGLVPQATQVASSQTAVDEPSSAAIEAARRAAEVRARQQAALSLTLQRLAALVDGRQAAATMMTPATPSRAAETLAKLEAVLGQRSARLNESLRTLGLRASALVHDSGEADTPLVKVSAPQGLSPALGVDALIAERMIKLARQAEATHRLAAALARLPLGEPVKDPDLSSRFGYRSDPFGGYAAFHAGQDFRGPRMSRIGSTAPGVVSFTGQRNGYGNVVEVDHGGGFKTRYAHLAAIFVRAGQKVGLGDRLGGMGSTGRSTGTHLHYEVWADGRAQNPARFLLAGQALAPDDTDVQQPAEDTSLGRGKREVIRLAHSVQHAFGRVHARFGG